MDTNIGLGLEYSDMQRTGATIKSLLSERNVSQSDISRMLDISATAVSKWTSGKAYPSPQHLCRLSEILDVSVDVILGAGRRVV